MKQFIVISIVLFLFVFLLKTSIYSKMRVTFWEVQSIDTMKYSRDLSREKLHDALFDAVIEQQVRSIAQTGATHVAIATPYDDEFLPILQRWVNSARRHNLNVWFRGNWSGWEKWFGYKMVTRAEHIEKTRRFILSHSGLFEDGDVFSACPECENGGPGDPRKTGDATAYRKFLIDEYKVTGDAFRAIKKDVVSNYLSMNGDVARLIMDKETTKKLGGIVTIDHYVATPEKLASDIQEIAKNSGGHVVLGEWGAPIGDIHGALSEEKQAAWIGTAFEQLVTIPELKGINYWVNVGSSTELWSAKGTARKAVDVLTQYYSPKNVKVTVLNSLGSPINNASITHGRRVWQTNSIGNASLPVAAYHTEFTIVKQGYKNKTIQVTQRGSASILLEKQNPGFFYRLLEKMRLLVRF